MQYHNMAFRQNVLASGSDLKNAMSVAINSRFWKRAQKIENEKCSVAQLCSTLCNPMDCSLPGSSVHGISQERTLEWVAIPFSRGSSQCRDQSRVSCIAGKFFTIWTTRTSAHKIVLPWTAKALAAPRVDKEILSLQHPAPIILSWKDLGVQHFLGPRGSLWIKCGILGESHKTRLIYLKAAWWLTVCPWASHFISQGINYHPNKRLQSMN